MYESFSAPVERVNPTTAEFIKYLSNTMLATMISYSNEMANAADRIQGIEIGRAFHILHKAKSDVFVCVSRLWIWRILPSEGYTGNVVCRNTGGRTDADFEGGYRDKSGNAGNNL